MPIDEATRIEPGSPYGESKFIIERILAWADTVHGLKSACLRYFNAAGAHAGGRIGEDHDPETHLIPLVLQAALGQRPHVEIFGTDYPTPDGTCVRDYVHVTDLADAHIRVLAALATRSCRYNLGNGQGYSVLQVIDTVRAVTGVNVVAKEGPRRPGDPATLVASSEAIRRDLGWTPRYAGLSTIVETAWAWRKRHPNGYAGSMAKAS
jgi:UDP-glucose 4-epimerase